MHDLRSRRTEIPEGSVHARRIGTARVVVAALVGVGVVFAGFYRAHQLPALGGLLDPISGVWAVARGAELPVRAAGTIPGLQHEVEVRYDRRAVPHIFAATEDDAARALGYVVARDRLFEVEVLARAGAGTLSELVGRGALSSDQETRSLGLPAAAEREAAALDAASPTGRTLRAYADGVNAWIDQLSSADLPLEYRLLGRHPVHWRPIDAFHVLHRMAFTLSYDPAELRRSRVAAIVGDTLARALIPVHSPLQQPIVPTADPLPHFLPSRLPRRPSLAIGGQSGIASGSSTALDCRRPGCALIDALPPALDRRVLGSNNWAVAPRRTRNGLALLAGDPHLDLTLPSIWYEVHVVVPGVVDVAGVTIPGGPAVILGFNRDVAWTATNTGSDALDFYRETVDDPHGPRRYLLDGRWTPVISRVEVYRGPAGDTLRVDTVRYTRRGPLRDESGQWLSMRWTALEAGHALTALIDASHARSVRSWLDAMRSYDGPTQNWLVADRSGTIAIQSVGVYPTRPGDGRGDEIRDGSRSSSDWTGALGFAQYPVSVDPAQGYLASANQEPIDPMLAGSNSQVYLGLDWPPPWRAIHINALLRADSSVTPDDMRRWQTDPASAEADFFVPQFLQAADRVIRTTPAAGIRGSLTEGARLLSEWDRRYTRTNTRAVLFEMTLLELNRRAFAVPGAPSQRPLHPSSAILAGLVNDSTDGWWSDAAVLSGLARQPAPRARDALLAASLAAATDSVRAHYGPPAAGGWRWDRVQQTNIYHLLQIPAFSRLKLPIQGGPSTLNPSTGNGTDGASWRMVVELGPEPRAWATYPGGQSGNPVSSRYADRLSQWLAGQLDSVRTPSRAGDLSSTDVSSRLSLTPR